MNEVLKAIKERRSIRRFKPDLPDKEMIEQIVEAGLYAPSGSNKQGVISLVVTNKEIREKFVKANKAISGRQGDFDPFYGAPVLIVVISDKTSNNCRYNGALVMENMMLAAHSLGLGSIWINRAYEEFETDEFKKLLCDLGIEGDWEGIGHCAIGYIDGDIPAAPPRKENRVYYVD